MAERIQRLGMAILVTLIAVMLLPRAAAAAPPFTVTPGSDLEAAQGRTGVIPGVPGAPISPRTEWGRGGPASGSGDGAVFDTCQIPGIQQLCQNASQLSNPVDAATRSATNSFISALNDWVASGATWVLDKVVAFVETSSAPRLDNNWFAANYKIMVGLAALVMLPLLLVAGARSALTGDPALALKAGFVYLPLAFFATFAAIHVVDALLSITDWMSGAFSISLDRNYVTFATHVGAALSGHGDPQHSPAASFVLFLSSILVVFFGFMVLLELLFRAACIYATALFLPMAFAGIILPSTTHLAKRLIEALFGLIISKLVIVAVMSLGVAALSADANNGGFGAVLAGVVILFLTAVVPPSIVLFTPLMDAASLATMATQRSIAGVIAPSSAGIYAQIRRTTEARLAGGAPGAFAGFTGGGPLRGRPGFAPGSPGPLTPAAPSLMPASVSPGSPLAATLSPGGTLRHTGAPVGMWTPGGIASGFRPPGGRVGGPI